MFIPEIADRERFQSGILRRLAFLHMLQFLVFSITGIVDCAAVGHSLGAPGLAGMKLAMPVFAVLYLFGNILGSGLSIQVTRLLAKGKRESANQCLLWVCTAVAAISLLCILAAAVYPEQLTKCFAGSGADLLVLRHTKEYLLPMLWGSFPIILQSVLSAVTALEGAGKRMTISVIFVLVADIAGDLLAIRMRAGMLGIASASVAAYVSSCLVLGGHLMTGKTIFRPDRLRKEKGLLLAVVTCGLPMAVRFFCECMSPIVINRLMLRYGTIAGLAALSIQDAAHYLPLSFCEGLGAAVLLLTGVYAAEQDHEALHMERRSVRRYSIFYGGVWTFLLIAATPILIKLFTGDVSLQSMGASAFRWYLLGVPFVSINHAVRAYLQGMGKQKAASTWTLMNQLVMPVVSTWLLGHFFGIPGIFAAFAIHEIVLALAYAGWQLGRRKTKKYLYGEENWDDVICEVRARLKTLEQTADASEVIIQMCQDHGVEEKQAMQMGLCLEELGTNSIQHGFRSAKASAFSGDKEGYLDYRFIITDHWLILRLRDNGRPYDLTEQYRLLNPEDSMAHLGLRLVYASADQVTYSHTFNLNNVCIRTKRTA